MCYTSQTTSIGVSHSAYGIALRKNHYIIHMNVFRILLQLLVIVFNKLSSREKIIYYKVNDKYLLQMNVSHIQLIDVA